MEANSHSLNALIKNSQSPVHVNNKITVVFSHSGLLVGEEILLKVTYKIDRLIRKGGRVIGRNQETLTDMYSERIFRKVTQIFVDDPHPLGQEFDLLLM